MHRPGLTKDPAAVAGEVRAAYQAMFPGRDGQFVDRVFGWAIDCFSGRFADYLPVDAPYHDLEHTLQATLCLSRLLLGWHRAEAQPPLTPEIVELGITAILFHDTGYLKQRGDVAGTGAKYTVSHVQRGCDLAARLLREKGFNEAAIRSVQNLIRCTGPENESATLDFGSDLERVVGYALGTADLLGQMAAEDYVEKLPVLYHEFAEAARHSRDTAEFTAKYPSPEDLMRQTPAFWENVVRPRLLHQFKGIYRYLNDPYPHGPNPYLDRIEANIERLRRMYP